MRQQKFRLVLYVLVAQLIYFRVFVEDQEFESEVATCKDPRNTYCLPPSLILYYYHVLYIYICHVYCNLKIAES